MVITQDLAALAIDELNNAIRVKRDEHDFCQVQILSCPMEFLKLGLLGRSFLSSSTR
jgi:hypothetical protein